MDGSIFITDENVFVTGKAAQSGITLKSVLDAHQESIDRLNGNVKWIYKYGGVGSGTGGGSGSGSSKMSVVATLNNVQILQGNVIQLDPDISSYELRVSVSGGGTYSAAVTWGNNKSTSLSLTVDNAWTKKYTVTGITSNGNINITVSDGEGGMATVYAQYITKAYDFEELGLLDIWGNEYTTQYVNIKEAQQDKGLVINCNYEVGIEGYAQYYWTVPEIFIGDSSTGSEDSPLSTTEKKSSLKFQIADNAIKNENAGDYTVTLKYRIVPTNGNTTDWITETVDFFLIPSGLYLAVTPSTSGSLYENRESTFDDIDIDTAAEIGGIEYMVSSNTISLEPNQVAYFDPTIQNESMSGKLFSFVDYDKTELVSEERDTIIYYRNTTSEPISVRLGYKGNEVIKRLRWELVDESNIVSHSVNRTIVMYGRVFAGAVSGNSGTIYYYLDGKACEPVIVTDTQRYNLPNIIFSNPGWHKLYFEYSFPYQGQQSTGEPVTRYVYVAEKTSNLNWFYNQANVLNQNYFRFDNTRTTFDDLLNNTTATNYDEKYVTDENEKVIDVKSIPDSDTAFDTFINIGLQYSDSNDDDEPLVSFQTKNPTSGYADILTIYCDKLVYNSNNEVNLFVPKTSVYDATDPLKYHLISINYRFIRASEDGALYRELVVYLDGVQEGTLPTWNQTLLTIDRVIFHNVNFATNLLEVDYVAINSTSSAGKRTYTPSIVDNNVVYYYYSYWTRSNNEPSLISDEKKKIMNLFFDDATKMVNYTVDESTELLKIDKSTFDTLTGSWSEISQRSGLPVLVATTPRIDSAHNIDIITQWMNGRYDEGSDSGDSESPKDYNIPITLKWGTLGGGIDDPFKDMECEYNHNIYKVSDVTQFTLKLQGSSTLRYKSKNFTLSLDWASGYDERTDIPLFSPNYNSEDVTTFLPESSYTLKADMVDSAHTNNVAIGRFVNDNNVFSNPYQSLSGENVDHVKQCLTGFPFIMILNTTTEQGEDEYYILGVYNFNLGRNSYFNLGYCDVSELDGIESTENNAFTFKIVENMDILPNFVCAEVQGNAKYWDFSQYDDTILFSKYNGDSGYYMFDDLVYSKTNTSATVSIRNFVESVSKAGGYLFNQLGKTFNPVGIDSSMLPYYHIQDAVPDNTYQYERTSKDVYAEKGRLESHGSESDLRSCIQSDDTSGVLVPEYLLYDSVLYYYMTCMAFGLVDSVQKNLNIKSWNNKTYGIYFYDMDTCLGVDNDGHFTSYFCFSDYWQTIVANPSKEYIDDKEVDVYQIDINNCRIYRDYYPEDASVSGFDIPSSYLYAVAKYAQVVLNFDYMNTATIWGKWRSTAGNGVEEGPLVNADKFIDKYYADHLSAVSETLMSLNYRNKYLAEMNDQKTGFNANTSTALHGKNIERTREWLKNRLHVLDGYFNLFANGEGSLTLYGNYNEPTPDKGVVNYTSNEDVYIYRDIFNSSNDQAIKRTGTLEFIVKAKEYSPLIILDGMIYRRLFLEDSDKYYKITYSYGGSTNSRFGGSPLWTYLDSINSFVKTIPSTSVFYLNSDRLENVSGSAGESTNDMTIKTPNAKTISLNSSGYSANLTIDSTFKNLSTIDLSNSKISLNLSDDGGQDIGVRTLKLRNLGGAKSVVINNTPKLTSSTVDLYNATITNCTISRSWNTDVMDMSQTKITSLMIMSSAVGTRFVIKNNETIKNLQINGFASIEVDNCPNLESVNIIANSQKDDSMYNISITNCAKMTSCSIGCKLTSKFTTLSFAGCLELSSLSMIGPSEADYSGITKLSFYNTALREIQWSDDSEYESGILNLGPFESLYNKTISLNLSYMTNVEYIKFKNSINTPARLNTNFTRCDNLKRIYGCVVIMGSTAFSNCHNFSIHGADLETETWMGKSVLANNGRIKPPYEVVEDYESQKAAFGPKKYSAGQQATRMRKYFQTSDDGKVTNMYFDRASFSSLFKNTNYTLFDVYYFLSMIPNEKITIGNYTTANITISLDSCFFLTSADGNNKFGRFYWNPDSTDYIDADGAYYLKANCDNSPNRYMFTYCPQLTNTNSMFCIGVSMGNYQKYYTQFKLYSPSTSGSNVSADDGVFSPLVNLTSMSDMFRGFSPCIDRFLFRRMDGQKYKITSFVYFQPNTVIDNVNNISSFPSELIYSGNFDAFGNLTDMFVDMGSLTTVHISFNGMTYINYDHPFNLPVTVTTVKNAFTSTYASGEMKLDNLFTPNSNGYYNVQKILSSYRVSTDISTKLSIMNTAEFYIDNDIFTKFIYLKKFGYNDESGDGHSDKGNETSSFNGAGIKKYISSSLTEFPYDILNNIIDPSTRSKCNNIEMLAGLFMNTSFKSGSYTPAELPGNMFSGNSKLTNVSSLFWNMGIDYTLTDGDNDDVKNFEDCTNLSVCQYLFGSEVAQTVPHLSGQIPYNLFYHGGGQVTVSAKIGFDVDSYDEAKTYTFDDVCVYGGKLYKFISVYDTSVGPFEPTEWQLINESGDILPNTISIEKQDAFSYEKVNATISDMKYCFTHSNTEAYTKESLTYETYDGKETSHIKRNPNYNRFDYLIDSSMLDASSNVIYKFHKNKEKDVHELTYCWAYDGDSEHRPISCLDRCDNLDPVTDDSSKGYTTIESLKETERPAQPDGDNLRNTYILNYAFPPDLLRYCQDGVQIQGLFYGSGSAGWASQYSGGGITLFVDTATSKSFGMTGRICPYMFKPVPKVTDLGYLFCWCRRLSGYATTDADGNIKNTYIIPEDLFSYLTSTQKMTLSYMFAGFVPPMYIDINVIKKMSSKSAIVTGMFYRSSWMGTQSNPLTISRIFGSSIGASDAIDTASTQYCFACSTTTTENYDDFPRTQYVVFDHVFKGYNKSSYQSNINYSYTFNGYKQATGFKHEITDNINNATVPTSSTLYNYQYFNS